jgi:mono/diheme cytochrome c family protein
MIHVIKSRVAAGIVASLVAACVSSGAFAQQADAGAGKSLWDGSQTQCRACHGNAGEGAFGPALAGRGLSAAEFRQAVRKPWGIMPAFTEDQVSDSDLANFAVYFAGLPKAAEVAPWRVPMPDDAKLGQKTAIALGCAQCHGATMDVARGIFGGTALGFAQFKDLVYDHVVAMPKLGIAEGNTPGQRLHMGNYNRLRISEQQLKTIYDWTRNDLGFRPFLEARLTGGHDESSAATYTLKVENSGFKKKGPAAEDMTVSMQLPPGVSVVHAAGDGYQGVHADVAEWRLAKLPPEESRSFAVTLSSPVQAGALKGSLRWSKPAPKTGAKFDSMNFTLR